MSVHVNPELLRVDARVVAPPPALRSCEDHNFELPTPLYLTMAALLSGFLAVLAIGLADPGLIVPMGINFVFLTAFFGIPVIFVRASRAGHSALGWSEFLQRGIMTATGHNSGREAAVLVLMLPAFIFLWAIAIVAIVATV
jgi:hypothetical protein